MTYMKIVSERTKRHLVLPEQDLGNFATLCGCTITRAGKWRLITALEGDECKKCADLSFSLRRAGNSLRSSDCDFQENTASGVRAPLP